MTLPAIIPGTPPVILTGENTARAVAAADRAEAAVDRSEAAADRSEGAANTATAALGAIDGRHAARIEAILGNLGNDLPASVNGAGFAEYFAFDATTTHAENVSRRHATLSDLDTDIRTALPVGAGFLNVATEVVAEDGSTVIVPAGEIPWNYSRPERTLRLLSASAMNLGAAQFALDKPFVFYLRAYRTAGVIAFDVILKDGAKYLDVYENPDNTGTEDAALFGKFQGTTQAKGAALYGLRTNGVEKEEIELIMMRDATGFVVIINGEEAWRFDANNYNGDYLEMFDPNVIEIARTNQPLDVAQILIANVDASFTESDMRSLFQRRHPYLRGVACAAYYGEGKEIDGRNMMRIPQIACAWQVSETRVEGLAMWATTSSPSNAEHPGQILMRPFAWLIDADSIIWLGEAYPFLSFDENTTGLDVSLPATMRAQDGTIYAITNIGGSGALERISTDGGRTWGPITPIAGLDAYGPIYMNATGSWCRVTEGVHKNRLITSVYTPSGVHTFWRDPNGVYGISPPSVDTLGYIPNESAIAPLPDPEKFTILTRVAETWGGGSVLNARAIYEASADGSAPVLIRILTAEDDNWEGSASGMGIIQLDPQGINGVKGAVADIRSRSTATGADTRFGALVDIYGAGYDTLARFEIMSRRVARGYFGTPWWFPELRKGILPWESSLDGFNGQSSPHIAGFEMPALDLRSPPPVPSALQFIRSASQPASGVQAGSTDSVPTGSDPLWYSLSEGPWTRIIGADTEAPFTVTATNPGSVTVVGKTATRTNATAGFAEGEVLLPSIVGGSRLRARPKHLGVSFANLITSSNGEFLAGMRLDGAGTAAAIYGYSGGASTSVAIDDEFEIRRATDGVTMSFYKNGTVIGAAGATTYGGASASSPGAGAVHLIEQFSSWEFLAYLPLGPNASIKVAQTSADGITWRTPTAGDTHLRVSNDAGITAPSVVIA